MSTPVDAGRDAYAERVRAALADLPAAERDDLLADLDDHLAEVAAEGSEDGDTLAERLGPPEAFAAELRAAAGLPPPADGRRRRSAALVPRAVLDFLPELRPAWWVLRGLVVAMLLGVVLGVAVGLLLAVATVPASVLLGRRTATEGRLRWVGYAVSTVVAGLLLLLLAGGLRGASSSGADSSNGPVYGPPPALGGVTNIYPYSSDGKPLTDVLLYDQYGNPIALDGGTDANGNVITVVPRYTRDGRVAGNVYPQEQTVNDLDPAAGTPTRRRVTPPAVTPPALQPR